MNPQTPDSPSSIQSVECEICGAALELDDVVANELVDCTDCGSEFEVATVDPLALKLAPAEAEDWGE